MRVLVVGGGIGGLSAAIALRKHGVDVGVVEINPNWDVYGVGIIQPGNAIRALDALSQRVGASGRTLPARAGRCTRSAGLLARHPCALASERRRTPG